MVRDINPGRGGSSNVRNLVPFRGELYFGANDGSHGFELWKTDGTEIGTVLAADLTPGPAGSGLLSVRSVGDLLYFSEHSLDSQQPSFAYVTDGTVPGTRLLKQFVSEVTSTICPGSCYGWPPGDYVSFAGQTYFIASDGTSGLELWRTDGTPLGTARVKDICPGNCSAFTFSDGLSALDGPQLKVVNGRLYFFGSTASTAGSWGTGSCGQATEPKRERASSRTFSRPSLALVSESRKLVRLSSSLPSAGSYGEAMGPKRAPSWSSRPAAPVRGS
jgi:ELWxxDGT repeat protein